MPAFVFIEEITIVMRAIITFTRFWNHSTVQLDNIKRSSGVIPHWSAVANTRSRPRRRMSRLNRWILNIRDPDMRGKPRYSKVWRYRHRNDGATRPSHFTTSAPCRRTSGQENMERERQTLKSFNRNAKGRERQRV